MFWMTRRTAGVLQEIAPDFFVKIRELNRNPQDTSDLSYDDVEHFLRFVDKYVSRVVGNNTYARWKKSHQTKTPLDKILA